MRFVNCEERDRNRLQRRVEAAAAKTFGSDIHELVFVPAQRVDTRALFRLGYGAIDERGWESARLKRINLIFHQRDEWRDYECRSIEDHRRELIAQRLAASGWHDDNSIFAFQNRSNHIALAFAKVVEAEVLSQRRDCIFKRVHARV